jgi:hypothetical protein
MGMPGVQLAALIGQRCPDARFLITCASVPEGAGAHPYKVLMKPFGRREFTAALRGLFVPHPVTRKLRPNQHAGGHLFAGGD